MRGRQIVLSRYLGNQLGERLTGEFNSDEIPRPANPARAERAIWRKSNFGKAKAGMRQKEVGELTEGAGKNLLVFREGVLVENRYPVSNLPVTRHVVAPVEILDGVENPLNVGKGRGGEIAVGGEGCRGETDVGRLETLPDRGGRGETDVDGVENLLNEIHHGKTAVLDDFYSGHSMGNAAGNPRWGVWDERPKIVRPAEDSGSWTAH